MGEDVAGRELQMATLTRLAETGEVVEVLNAKADKTWFPDDDAREAFILGMKHFAAYGEFPSILVLKDVAPMFEPVTASDSVRALLSRLRERKLYDEIERGTEVVLLETRSNPMAGLDKLREMAAKLTISHAVTNTLDATATAVDVVSRYRHVRDTRARGELIGIATPWEHLNTMTQGHRAGDYTVWYARRKSFKSWLLCYQAYWAHRYCGKHVVFGTREMLNHEIQDRMVALYAGIDWGAFYLGTLNSEEERRLELATEEFLDGGRFNVIQVMSNGEAAAGEFQARCEEHEADISFLDGIHLYAQGAEWNSMAAVNRALRQVALNLKIPLIGATQENKEGDTGYITFEQDATALFRVHYTPEQAALKEVMIEPMFMRNAPPDLMRPWTVHRLPAYGFKQKAVLSEEGDGGGIKSDDEPGTDLMGAESGEKTPEAKAEERVNASPAAAKLKMRARKAAKT